VGDKVHRTATCDDDLPQLITHVETAIGPTSEGAAPPRRHAALQQRGLRPGTPSVDTGFLDAERLVDSQEHSDVERLGPTRLADHGQAREGAGGDAQHVQMDGDRPHATCPAGKTSSRWPPAIENRDHPVIKLQFSTQDYRHGTQFAPCGRSKTRDPRRTLTLRPQPPYQALQTARQRDATPACQEAYARRAGIEGTSSRGTRSTRLRRTRDRGLPRVRLGHILTAVGLNGLRRGAWCLETTRAKTRLTPFARLMAHAPAA
jgi:transposase